MREFYIKDKNNNIAYIGIAPSNDVNCLPFDYFRLTHAKIIAREYEMILKAKCPKQIPKVMVLKYALNQTDAMISKKLDTSSPNSQIHELLSNVSLSKKEQEKLLKGANLSVMDLLWLNKEAQDLGYLLDIYHEEKYPKKFNMKQHPVLYHEKNDGTMETIGNTDMTDGEMRSLLEQRKVVQARIYHKENIWHCFYFTFKGIAGKESGLMGSRPHYHYISNKFGIILKDLVAKIKDCNMPSSNVHVVIEKS